MHTRRQARQLREVNLTAAAPPHLPVSLQLSILDTAIAAFADPDAAEYSLWPFSTSMTWLVTLHHVCTQWHRHMQQQPIMLRRVRLEKLKNLAMLHDYAYYIMSNSKSRRQRASNVRRSISLNFADGSAVAFDVPKGGVSGAAKLYKQRHHSTSPDITGLPAHALLLVCECGCITSKALLELLSDLHALDEHHTTPLLLQVHSQSANHDATLSSPQPSSMVDGVLHCSSNPGVESNALEALQAAALAANVGRSGELQDIVMEGDCTSRSLMFIPTAKGFCRRLPFG